MSRDSRARLKARLAAMEKRISMLETAKASTSNGAKSAGSGSPISYAATRVGSVIGSVPVTTWTGADPDLSKVPRLPVGWATATSDEEDLEISDDHRLILFPSGGLYQVKVVATPQWSRTSHHSAANSRLLMLDEGKCFFRGHGGSAVPTVDDLRTFDRDSFTGLFTGSGTSLALQALSHWFVRDDPPSMAPSSIKVTATVYRHIEGNP